MFIYFIYLSWNIIYFLVYISVLAVMMFYSLFAGGLIYLYAIYGFILTKSPGCIHLINEELSIYAEDFLHKIVENHCKWINTLEQLEK